MTRTLKLIQINGFRILECITNHCSFDPKLRVLGLFMWSFNVVSHCKMFVGLDKHRHLSY